MRRLELRAAVIGATFLTVLLLLPVLGASIEGIPHIIAIFTEIIFGAIIGGIIGIFLTKVLQFVPVVELGIVAGAVVYTIGLVIAPVYVLILLGPLYSPEIFDIIFGGPEGGAFWLWYCLGPLGGAALGGSIAIEAKAVERTIKNDSVKSDQVIFLEC